MAPLHNHLINLRARLPGAAPSAVTTLCACPPTGEQAFRDIVWCYPEPLDLVAPIAGYACCYQECVDAIMVDGEAVLRPQNQWSRK